LKQSGKIAHDDLVQHLAKYGYSKAKRTDGLFLHKTRDLSFTLVVDDFGIKYTNKDDVNHLIAAVRDKYPLKVNWDAKQKSQPPTENSTLSMVITSITTQVLTSMVVLEALQI
jgi:hypothetical protein